MTRTASFLYAHRASSTALWLPGSRGETGDEADRANPRKTAPFSTRTHNGEVRSDRDERGSETGYRRFVGPQGSDANGKGAQKLGISWP